ncbi:MAG: substrate-binding domain-containing protein [Spirochaetota bacterium]
MRRRIWLIIIAAAALVPIVSLGLPRVARLLEPPGDESVYVVLKTTGPHMEFWQIVRAGIQAAATELNVTPQIVGPQWEKDIDRQIEILAEVIEADPDAILLAASDYNRLVPLAEEAAARGITVVTLDSALNSSAPVSFVATDNVAAGMKAGREIDRLVPRDRSIAIISHIRGVATAIDRENGVLEALAHRNQDMVLGPYYSQNDPDLGREIVINLLAEYPDLGGIVAMNENSTVGAGRALEELRAWNDIDLVGFDNSQEEIEFLEDGIVKALVVQRPFNMGYIGISTLVHAIRGSRVEPVIHTDSVLVRKEDMFTEENQKLLFPIIERE